jgi:hypothetical protein
MQKARTQRAFVVVGLGAWRCAGRLDC